MIATRQTPSLLRAFRSAETGCAHAPMKALFQLAAATLLPREPDPSADARNASCPHPDRCRFCGCDDSCHPPPRAA